MADFNSIGFDNLFNFDDDTKLKNAIELIERFGSMYNLLIDQSKENAQSYSNSIKKILDSTDALEAQLKNLDATKKADQQATIKLANEAEKALKKTEAFTAGLKAEDAALAMLEDQQRKLEAAAKKLAKTQQSQAGSVTALKKELKLAQKAYEDLGDATDKAVKQEAAQRVNDLRKAVRESNAAFKETKESVQFASGSYNELNTRVKQAKKDLKDMEGGIGSASQEFQDLQKFVKEGSDQLKAFDKAIGDNFRSVGDYTDSIIKAQKEIEEQRRSTLAMATAQEQLDRTTEEGEKRFQGLAQAIQVNIGQLNILQRAAGQAEESLDQLKNGQKQISSGPDLPSASSGGGPDLGVATDTISGIVSGGGIGSVAGGLASSVPQLAAATAAIGAAAAALDHLQELTKEVNDQLSLTNSLTGLLGDSLEELTAGIRATSATFGKDYNEVLLATNTLMEEFGLEGDEALDIINRGFVAGADDAGQFLDTVREYSTQFRKAGLDAEALVKIIQFSADKGIFDDKGADVVKEAGLRIREMTKATVDALAPLGKLTVEQINQATAAGDSFKAIQLVSQGLKEVDLTAQQTQAIIADVFGGPGEDAGQAFIESLADIDVNVKNATEGLNAFQLAQLDLLDAEQAVSSAEVELGKQLTSSANGYKTLGLNIKAFFYNALVAVLNGLKPIKASFAALGDAFSALFTQIKKFLPEAEQTGGFFQNLGKYVMLAVWPLRAIVKVLTFCINTFVMLIDMIPGVGSFFSYIAEGFSKLTDVVASFPAVLNGLLFAWRAAVFGIKDLVIDQFSAIGDIIKAALDPTADVGDAIDKAKARFSKYGQDIGEAFWKGYNEAREEEAELIADPTDPTSTEKKEAEKKKPAAPTGDGKANKEYLALLKWRLEQAIKVQEAITKNVIESEDKRLKAAQEAQRLRGELASVERRQALAETDLTASQIILANEQYQAKLTEIAQTNSEERLDIMKTEAEQLIAISDSVYENELNSYQDRYTAAVESAAERLKVLTLLFDNGKIAEEEYYNQVLALAADQNAKLLKLDQDRLDNQQDRDQTNISLDTNKYDLDINRQFEEGQIKDAEEFARVKQQIQDDAQLESLSSQLEYLKQQRDLLNKYGYDTLALDKSISDTELAISNAKIEKRIEQEGALHEALKNLQQTAYDTALSVVSSFNDAADERRTAEMEKLQENYDQQIAMAGDNEARKVEITNQFNAQKDKLAKEQAAADRKRAVFEKATAIFEIAVNTAVAVSKAVAAAPLTGGLPFSAIAAAIGALQIAAVLARPLPAYETGTDYAKGGLSMINEKGRELVVTPNKKAFMYNSSGAVVANVPRGSKVFTAEQTAQIFEDNNVAARMVSGYDDYGQKLQHIKWEMDTDTMTRALSGKLDDLIGITKRNKPRPTDNSSLGREIAKGINSANFEQDEYR